MRKETDLRKVKATARALLMLDIGETNFSPMIVNHPFNDSGTTAVLKSDGGIRMLDLMDDPSDLKRWRVFVRQTIKKAGSAYEVYMMVTKPYSIGHYCKTKAACTTTMADLAAATAVYGYYAKQFFA